MTEMKARSGARMPQALGWVDVVCLGVGGMVGAGVFVTAGIAANRLAGPSVVLSFLSSGFSALLSAFCYAEFSAHLPSAGGAFSYLRISLGELAAYITGANLLLEYVISNAVVARTFTSYLATVFGSDGSTWLLKLPAFLDGYYLLDFPAFALVLILTLCICCSTKRSSRLNILMTLLHIALILFVTAAAFWNGKSSNLTHAGSPSRADGFFPYGVRGVFEGAAVVYFSFIGYDSVSTMAEEVKNPSRNMPIGIAGSVVVVTFLYCAMAMALSMLLPYDQIDVDAPFARAFRSVAGWSRASNVVGMGACLGIVTSLLVAMLGQARYLCVMARAHLVPPCLARVDSVTGTPIRSSVFLGALTAIIALLVESSILLDLISIGTLFVFYMVAIALIFRRHTEIGAAGSANQLRTAVFLAVATVLSAGFAVFLRMEDRSRRSMGLAFCGSSLVLSTAMFRACVPTVKQANALSWKAPCMPWLAVASIFVNVVMAGSLNVQAYVRFGIWSLLAVLFYVGYGLHAAHDAEERTGEAAMSASDECTLLDLDPPGVVGKEGLEEKVGRQP